MLGCALNFALHEASRVAECVQVKHRGQYSNPRMMALRHFSRSTPLWQIIAATVVTPLPGLAIIAVFEAQRLNPPSAGLEQNKGFYLREFVTFATFCIMLLQQFCSQVGPALPMPASTMIATAFITAGLNTGANYLVASAIGFPIPFTITVSASVHLLVQATALALLWYNHVRANPALVINIVRGSFLFACQCFLVILYPIYYYTFTLVPESITLRLATLSLLFG